ncbi:MAG: uroporphyrinogen decarboxylase family protein [Oscillospiraceae bacterium]|jgi:uroporphyrinogen decarboxylase|nr:uroporphyrinogen decarboxylase family protein [Oscillospiraceae bacterium]
MPLRLTSRERVSRAIARHPLDRVPIDLGMHYSTGISVFAYQRLREALGLSTDHIELVDQGQLLARVDEDVLDRFHVDTVLLEPPWLQHRVWNPCDDYFFQVSDRFTPERMADGGWRFTDRPNGGVMPAGGFFFDGAVPDGFGLSPKERLALYARRAEMLYKETDRFTMQMGFSAYFDGLDFACDMLTDPGDCKALLARRLTAEIARFDEINRAYGRWIQSIEVNSDLGTQNGPMVTPDSYRDICLPPLKRFCAHVHETSDIKIFLHCCGGIYELIPSIIEAGVDALNPVQISARGMDSARLKREFGDKICFWGGGCDTQRVLWSATPEEVRAHVREQMETFKPGGGFVFNQVHNIMGNVPPENVIAMLDAAYEFGGYGDEEW